MRSKLYLAMACLLVTLVFLSLNGAAEPVTEYQDGVRTTTHDNLNWIMESNFPTITTANGYDGVQLITSGGSWAVTGITDLYEVKFKNTGQNIVQFEGSYIDSTLEGFTDADYNGTVNDIIGNQARAGVMDTKIYYENMAMTDYVNLTYTVQQSGIKEWIKLTQPQPIFDMTDVVRFKYYVMTPFNFTVDGIELPPGGWVEGVRNITMNDLDYEWRHVSPLMYLNDGMGTGINYTVQDHGNDIYTIWLNVPTKLLRSANLYPIDIDPGVTVWDIGNVNRFRAVAIEKRNPADCHHALFVGDEIAAAWNTETNSLIGILPIPNVIYRDVIEWRSRCSVGVTEFMAVGYTAILNMATMSRFDVTDSLLIKAVDYNFITIPNMNLPERYLLDISMDNGNENPAFAKFYVIGRNCITTLDGDCGGTITETLTHLDYQGTSISVLDCFGNYISPNTWQNGEYFNDGNHMYFHDRNGRIGTINPSGCVITAKQPLQTIWRPTGWISDHDIDGGLEVIDPLIGTTAIYNSMYFSGKGVTGYPNDATAIVWNGVTNAQKNILTTGSSDQLSAQHTIPTSDDLNAFMIALDSTYTDGWIIEFDTTTLSKLDQTYFFPKPWGMALLNDNEGYIANDDGVTIGFGFNTDPGIGINSPLDLTILPTDGDGSDTTRSINIDFTMYSDELETATWVYFVNESGGGPLVHTQVGALLPGDWTLSPTIWNYEYSISGSPYSYSDGNYDVDLIIRDSVLKWSRSDTSFYVAENPTAQFLVPINHTVISPTPQMMAFTVELFSGLETWQGLGSEADNNYTFRLYNGTELYDEISQPSNSWTTTIPWPGYWEMEGTGYHHDFFNEGFNLDNGRSNTTMVNITATTPPWVNIDQPIDYSTFTTCESITFQASYITYNPGVILNWTWEIRDHLGALTLTEWGPIFEISDLPPGWYNVTVIFDDGWHTREHWLDNLTIERLPPTIVIDQPLGQATVGICDDVEFNSTYGTTNVCYSPTLNFTWDIRDWTSGILQHRLYGQNVSLTGLDEGRYNVSVKFDDSFDFIIGWVPGGINVTYVITATITEPTTGAVIPYGDDVELKSDYSTDDICHAPVLNWTWNLNSTDGGSNITLYGRNVTASNLDNGTYNASLTFGDGTKTIQDWIEFIVAPYNISVEITQPLTGTDYTEGDTVSFKSIYETDNPTPVLNFTWNLNSTDGGSNITLYGRNVTTADLTPGNYIVTLVFNDGLYTRQDTINIRVLAETIEPPPIDDGIWDDPFADDTETDIPEPEPEGIPLPSAEDLPLDEIITWGTIVVIVIVIGGWITRRVRPKK